MTKKISGTALVDQIKGGKYDFYDLEVTDGVSMPDHQFEEHLALGKVRVHGNLSLYKGRFNGGLDLEGVTCDELFLFGSEFGGDVSIGKLQACKKVDMSGARFLRELSIFESKLTNGLEAKNCNFASRMYIGHSEAKHIDFAKSLYNDEAVFDSVSVGWLNLSEARANANLVVRSSKIEHWLSLNKARVCGDLNLSATTMDAMRLGLEKTEVHGSIYPGTSKELAEVIMFARHGIHFGNVLPHE